MTVDAQASAAHLGAANPKAIAELRLGKALDPSAPDFEAELSRALELPYEHLFDPKFGSAVFAGAKDLYTAPAREREPHPVTAPPAGGAGVAVAEPALRLPVIKPVQVPVWWPGLFTDLKYAVPGVFIVDVPTATSPVQGALADCWLISAMASVAWCTSDLISERTVAEGNGVLASGQAGYEFTFYASSNWSQGKTLTVRDDVPQSNGAYIYARSSVPGETWPANVEKAFIGMRGPTGVFEPSSSNYNELNYGDCAWATASLVGRPPWYHAANAADAWATISARCTNGRTTLPLTAWTYGSAPAGLSYDGSGIVGNHCYSILGIETSGGQDYVVLRNPWGFHEGQVDTLSGSWQGLTLPGNGVFAMRIDAFAEYYAGFGGA
jgi:hypothetical protein